MRLSHPCIMPFLGTCDDFDYSKFPSLVSPYFKHGNVNVFLEENTFEEDVALVKLKIVCLRICLFTVYLKTWFFTAVSNRRCFVLFTRQWSSPWWCKGRKFLVLPLCSRMGAYRHIQSQTSWSTTMGTRNCLILGSHGCWKRRALQQRL